MHQVKQIMNQQDAVEDARQYDETFANINQKALSRLMRDILWSHAEKAKHSMIASAVFCWLSFLTLWLVCYA